MNAPDHMAQVRQLRALAGPRPVDNLVADMRSGVSALDTIVGRWGVFPPRPSTMADADALVEGLKRTLVELRHAQSAGGPQDAT